MGLSESGDAHKENHTDVASSHVRVNTVASALICAWWRFHHGSRQATGAAIGYAAGRNFQHEIYCTLDPRPKSLGRGSLARRLGNFISRNGLASLAVALLVLGSCFTKRLPLRVWNSSSADRFPISAPLLHKSQQQVIGHGANTYL